MIPRKGLRMCARVRIEIRARLQVRIRVQELRRYLHVGFVFRDPPGPLVHLVREIVEKRRMRGEDT